MKSSGNLDRLRLTCSLSRLVLTPYKTARSASSMIFDLGVKEWSAQYALWGVRSSLKFRRVKTRMNDQSGKKAMSVGEKTCSCSSFVSMRNSRHLQNAPEIDPTSATRD